MNSFFENKLHFTDHAIIIIIPNSLDFGLTKWHINFFQKVSMICMSGIESHQVCVCLY